VEGKTFKIFLPRMVHGDWPIGHDVIAKRGIHTAIKNRYGAVSVVLPGGSLLGVKPGEFEELPEGELEPIASIAERVFPEEVKELRSVPPVDK
jgi:hypothetical protein